MEAPPAKASKLEIFGWCMFDFANSSYTTIIVTFAYSVYFVEAVAGGAGLPSDTADFLWGLGTGVSQGLVVVTAPVVGAIADFSGAKKRFLLISYLWCVLGTACLGFVGPGDITLGFLLYVVSNVFYSAGENLVAAFLPEIASQENMGRVSGRGWSLGYMGGLGSIAASYPFLKDGIDASHWASVQLSFLVVAIFFLLGGLPTFVFLRERAAAQKLAPGEGYLRVGFRRVSETLRRVRRYRQLFRFLFVFLSYTCGINVVVAFAIIFAKRELGLTTNDLLIFFLFMQISASMGALVFGAIQDRINSKLAIQLSLVLWLGVCVGGYLTHTLRMLYAVGTVAGLAMGSAQSAGRALVGSFSPVERTGEFFGFWGLFWKLAGAGPLLFGMVRWAGVHTRTAILLTGLFFLAGIAGMFFIDEGEGKRAAREASGTSA